MLLRRRRLHGRVLLGRCEARCLLLLHEKLLLLLHEELLLLYLLLLWWCWLRLLLLLLRRLLLLPVLSCAGCRGAHRPRNELECRSERLQCGRVGIDNTCTSGRV